MPYLRFAGFDKRFIQELCAVLVKEFAQVAAVPLEIVKVELLDISRVTATPCSLEILMFPRTQEKHDAIAEKLHGLLSISGYRDVHIFFTLLTQSLYYKEGAPLRNVSWL